MAIHPFNEGDRTNMTAFAEHILEGHRAGTIDPASAAGALVSTMMALGAGDLDAGPRLRRGSASGGADWH